MNVADEASRSCWMEAMPGVAAPPLCEEEEIEADFARVDGFLIAATLSSLEECWDCPCHGSQFAVDDSVLSGPAVRSLALVDKPAEADPATA